MTNQILGFKSFVDFVDEYFERTRYSCAVVSDKTIQKLKEFKWSDNWQHSLLSHDYGTPIFRICRQIGMRASPFNPDPFLGDPYNEVFHSAASLGLFAAMRALGQGQNHLERWFESNSQMDLIGLASVPSPKSPDPLKAFQIKCRNSIKRALDENEEEAKKVSREYPRSILIDQPTIRDSLERSARIAAILASIAFDPSEVRLYRFKGQEKERIVVNSFTDLY